MKQIEVLGIAAGLAVAVVVVGAVALTGLILGAVAVGRGTSSSVDLPGNLALLADPSAVTGGLVTQNGAELTVVPFAVDNTTINFALDSVGAGAATAINGTNRVRGLRANGTLDLAYTVVGNDVLLTGNLPATAAKLCGVSCTGNDVLAMAPNGTCLLCSTGVRATSFMRTCGTCPAFASVRLAANSSCYECLSISPNNILVGGGEVHAAARANDTFVYSTMPQMLADCTSATVGLTSYTYISGAYKITTYPTDYPGNTNNFTTYQVDVSTNTMLSAPAGNATTVVAVRFDVGQIIPGWIATPFQPYKSVFTGAIACLGVPAPGTAFFVFGNQNWHPAIQINTEYELINSLCYVQFSVFWVNG